MPIPTFAGECGCLLNAQVRPCDTVLGTHKVRASAPRLVEVRVAARQYLVA